MTAQDRIDRRFNDNRWIVCGEYCWIVNGKDNNIDRFDNCIG